MSVTAAAGFRAAGVAAGIKPSGLDLALVACDGPVAAAAVFTVNQAAAAPVAVSRRHLGAGRGIGAVVLNSGCANAATGDDGLASANAMAETTARSLGLDTEQVLVCSTGTIGTRLPLAPVLAGIGDAAVRLDTSSGAATAAAAAIMTTDSTVKETFVRGDGFVVGGMAKGAGMIRPDMATMLALVTTDAAVEPAVLTRLLSEAVDHSFHELNVDGCPSTNDTVIALASGASGVKPDPADLGRALTQVCRDLAERIAADAEGATRVVTIEVIGAADDASARILGRDVADSALVRASFYGGDANWGRVVGALGASSVPFDPASIEISYEGTVVASGGVGTDHDEAGLLKALAKGDFTITVQVGDGPGRATILTTDLTPEYVRFNGERS